MLPPRRSPSSTVRRAIGCSVRVAFSPGTCVMAAYVLRNSDTVSVYSSSEIPVVSALLPCLFAVSQRHPNVTTVE